jgi:hypothetical protein
VDFFCGEEREVRGARLVRGERFDVCEAEAKNGKSRFFSSS